LSEQSWLDVLVNNAGYAVYGAIEQISLTDARRQFEVNLFGLTSLTQKILPIMRTQKSGHIINITSIGGKVYTPLGAWRLVSCNKTRSGRLERLPARRDSSFWYKDKHHRTRRNRN
jgi:NAD(P)-dependent dehydrogenase (short-subunit alcohol dehydrogenase family)